MKIALLYDVHGNLPALEAVLADARREGAERFLLGGDYAAFGAWPAETVAALDGLGPGAVWIRGNWDRWLGGEETVDMPGGDPVQGAARFALGRLDEATVARLAALPATHAADGALFCHGSPGSDMESFGARAEPRDRELLAPAPGDARLVVFGHTHVQFERAADGGGPRLVNPGSVGLPLDGDPRAAYALLGGDGEVRLRRVAYPHGEAVTATRAIGEPWALTIAGRLERAAA